MEYTPVDLGTPWILYWCAGIALVAGACLVGAGGWRARRHRRFVEATGRNADVSLLQDTRTQRRVGGVALALAAVLVAVGVGAHLTGLSHLRAGLTQKYGYASVERIRQSGSGFVADLTTADGAVLRDRTVLVDPSGEPFVGEDIFRDVAGGS